MKPDMGKYKASGGCMGPTEDAFLHSLLTVTRVDAPPFEYCRGLDSAWTLNCLALGLKVLTL